MSAELEHIWSRVQAELALSVDEPTYRIWLAPLRPLRARRRAPARSRRPPHAARWIRDRFGRVLESCAAKRHRPRRVVELVDRSSGRRPARQRTAAPRAAAPGRAAEPRRRDRSVGPARARAQRPARQPEADLRAVRHRRLQPPRARRRADRRRDARAGIQPAVHLRPPGVGKTHLLSSIATLLLAHNPGLTVRCTTGEAFTNEFLDSLGGGAHRRLQGALSRRRRAAARRRAVPRAQDQDRGGVLPHVQRAARRRPPDRRSPPTARRTTCRLSRTACASASRPDSSPTSSPPTSPRAWRSCASAPTTTASSSPTSWRSQVIAERIDNNVRALEGALIRVVAFSSLTGRPLTARARRGGARHALSRAAGHRRHGAGSIAEIQAAVVRALRRLTATSSSRPRAAAALAWPRQVAMYLARELTGESLPAIGTAVRRARPHDRPARLPAHRSAHRRRRSAHARLWRSCVAALDAAAP